MALSDIAKLFESFVCSSFFVHALFTQAFTKNRDTANIELSKKLAVQQEKRIEARALALEIREQNDRNKH